MEIVLVWLVLAIGVGLLANSRGRSGLGFFLLSLLLSPIVGFIAALVTANLKEEDRRRGERIAQETESDRKRREDHELQVQSIKVIADSQRPSLTAASHAAPTASIADEIRKLAQLRAESLLTDAEFEHQKSVLLGRPSTASPAAATRPPAQFQ